MVNNMQDPLIAINADQSVKWLIKIFGQNNILTCTREKNPFATIGLSGGLVFEAHEDCKFHRA